MPRKGQSLIIVESPAKAKTIERYLHGEYRVMACNGHIKDLPKSKIGVDIENGFIPQYVTLKDRTQVLRSIREKARSAPQVLLATDPDREGEAIAWHLQTELDSPGVRVRRVLFNEITPSGIQDGLGRPRDVDMSLVKAQQARRIIDRLVGFEVSRFLWTVMTRGLSAGRVQSVALRLICERQAEIDAFIAREYWSVEADFLTAAGASFRAALHQIAGKKAEIATGEEAGRIVAALQGAEFVIASIEKKSIEKRPFAPFITSSLQQDAASRLGFAPAKTMKIAQSLYEGIDAGDGERTGLITYMRTDSTRVSKEAIAAVRTVIRSRFGEEYLPHRPNAFKSKKSAQEAHEAIRPARPDVTPEALEGKIGRDEWRLYSLIWQRFTSSQMKPGVANQTTVDVTSGDYLFRATGSTIVFDGFRRAYPTVQESDEPMLPATLADGEAVTSSAFYPEQHFTRPPAAFTESSLIKELDIRGIGRPSTFAEIVSRLYQRLYVRREQGRMSPTDVGIAVNKILVTHFPDLFSVRFTARMEEELDGVESGETEFLQAMNDFYHPFHASMERVGEQRVAIKGSLVEGTDQTCEKCGRPMVIKWNSRKQKFLSCSGFPECKNARPLSSDGGAVPELAGKPCPKCGKNLLVKTGRFGRYLGCEAYPDCRHTESFSTGVACPNDGCPGHLVERRSRKRGKLFFGCNQYPKCDFATWNRPVNQPCAVCGSKYIEEKWMRGGKSYLACPSCKGRQGEVGGKEPAEAEGTEE